VEAPAGLVSNPPGPGKSWQYSWSPSQMDKIV
jgi:hypothetical protein